MKIVHTTGKAVTENVRQVQQKKQQLITKTKMHKGHTMFEYNILEGTISPAKFEEAVAPFRQKVEGKGPVAHFDRLDDIIQNPVSKKLIMNKNCLYVSALNEKSAIKKLIKRYKK